MLCQAAHCQPTTAIVGAAASHCSKLSNTDQSDISQKQRAAGWAALVWYD